MNSNPSLALSIIQAELEFHQLQTSLLQSSSNQSSQVAQLQEQLASCEALQQQCAKEAAEKVAALQQQVATAAERQVVALKGALVVASSRRHHIG